MATNVALLGPNSPVSRRADCLQSPHGTQPKKNFNNSVPSRGSKNHHLGMCRPCKNFSTPKGCSAGSRCNFCHFTHDEVAHVDAEARAARKQLRRALSSALTYSNEDEAQLLEQQKQFAAEVVNLPPLPDFCWEAALNEVGVANSPAPASEGWPIQAFCEEELASPCRSSHRAEEVASPCSLSTSYQDGYSCPESLDEGRIPEGLGSDPARALEELLNQFGGEAVAELLKDSLPACYED